MYQKLAVWVDVSSTTRHLSCSIWYKSPVCGAKIQTHLKVEKARLCVPAWRCFLHYFCQPAHQHRLSNIRPYGRCRYKRHSEVHACMADKRFAKTIKFGKRQIKLCDKPGLSSTRELEGGKHGTRSNGKRSGESPIFPTTYYSSYLYI